MPWTRFFGYRPLEARFLAVAFCYMLTACKLFSSQVKSAERGEYSLRQYIRDCEEVLGPIPRIDCRLVDENVIWTLDVNGRPKQVTLQDSPFSVKHSEQLTCVNPAPVGEHRCHPHNRFGTLAAPDLGGKGTTWWAGCQRGTFAHDPDPFQFMSVSLIGATASHVCFFRSRNITKGVNAEIESPRDEPERWHEPKEFDGRTAENCVRCHYPNPYLRDSFMRHRNVAKALGVTVEHFPSQKLFTKYWQSPVEKHYRQPVRDAQVPQVVGMEHFGTGEGEGLWQGLVTDEPVLTKTCQTCHLLSGGFFNARYIPQLFGLCDLKDSYGNHCKGMDPRAIARFPDQHLSFLLPGKSVVPAESEATFKRMLKDYFERCWDTEDFTKSCRYRVLQEGASKVKQADRTGTRPRNSALTLLSSAVKPAHTHIQWLVRTLLAKP